MNQADLTVRDLRRLWIPHKFILTRGGKSHPTHLRFHRACSWLDRAEQLDQTRDADFAILARWTAFNALYGQWDEALKEPVADRDCWRHFLERILDLDQNQRVDDVLMDHKSLAMKIFEDEYLDRHFWRSESPDQAMEQRSRYRKTGFQARTWYVEGRRLIIVEELFQRIYLLRCQLVHGAATYGSQLNRVPVRHCNWMIEHLLTAMLRVWIDRGYQEDWGIACYPPLDSSVGKPAR